MQVYRCLEQGCTRGDSSVAMGIAADCSSRLSRHVHDAALAARRVIDLARLRFRDRDELLDVLHRHRRMHDDEEGALRDLNDRREEQRPITMADSFSIIAIFSATVDFHVCHRGSVSPNAPIFTSWRVLSGGCGRSVGWLLAGGDEPQSPSQASEPVFGISLRALSKQFGGG